MSYLLDSNICILLIRQNSPQVLARLTSHVVTDVYISALTVAELQYGVEKSTKPTQNQHALDQFLLPLTILPFDGGAGAHYGKIRTHLEAQGLPIGALDTLIAAQALQHSLIAVTNNVREFSRVPGLALEDWSQP
ncbi:MAG: type II toxin-antitoxin system VapC family toxin [Chloroflexi bacterium]|nr:type II toxin-antitoxin system VapC family toxin [Chloroflexota bacterium]